MEYTFVPPARLSFSPKLQTLLVLFFAYLCTASLQSCDVTTLWCGVSFLAKQTHATKQLKRTLKLQFDSVLDCSFYRSNNVCISKLKFDDLILS